MRKVQIPPLVPMIIMGILARNYGGSLSAAYPPLIASWLRNCVVAILLTRGGMAITFKGKGLLVVLIILVPQFLEASTVAVVAQGLFQMPYSIAYCLGYCMATVAGSLVVPVMLSFLEKGIGKDHGVPSTLIACCTFENIAAIIFFGICKAVAFSQADAEITGEESDMAMSIGFLFVHNLAGLFAGLVAGLGAYFFKFINPKYQ